MDPVSTIGVVSATITFVEFTWDFVRKVYEIHEGRSTGDETIKDIAKKMNELSAQLITPTWKCSQHNSNVQSLARICHRISFDLLGKLDKIATTEKTKPGNAISIAVKAICSQNRIDRLQKTLDRANMHLQTQILVLQSDQSSELLQKLESISDAQHDWIEKGQEQSNQKAILSAIKPHLMNERYHDVSKAAENTFQWIFTDTNEQQDSNPKLKYPFKDWLLTGDGIFHIAGKPGSGKSSLMKFLYQHQETQKALQLWASDNPLTVARFFFWKPGQDFQKSFKGLIRTLLYQILEQDEEAIPTLFPWLWSPTGYNFGESSHHKLEITDDDVEKVFSHILKENTNRRYCFFVDGLDEFEEPYESLGYLVKKLHTWLETSNGSLKVCVSSREFPIFMDKFYLEQRIRLQDLTKRDMEQFVRQHLDEQEHFQVLKRQDATGCEKFIPVICEKADGVFLWLALTMKQIAKGCELQLSLGDLTARLDSIPQKLEEFFGYILDSVHAGHEHDRQLAHCTFAYLLEKGHFSLDFHANLIQCSYLAEFLKSPEFAMNMPYHIMSDQEVSERLKIGATQVIGNCMGLVETRPTPLNGNTYTMCDVGDQVKFTHRSVVEFLKTRLKSRTQIPTFPTEFDPKNAIIQTYLAVLKSMPLCIEYKDLAKNAGLSCIDLASLIGLISNTERDKTQYFPSLDILNETLRLRQSDMWPDFPDGTWSRYKSCQLLPFDHRIAYNDIIIEAAVWGLQEYSLYKIKNSPDEMARERGTELQAAALSGKDFYLTKEGDVRLLEYLFSNAGDPNCRANAYAELDFTIWSSYLAYKFPFRCQKGKTNRIWVKVETCLRYGADPPVWSNPFPDKNGQKKTEEEEEEEEEGECVVLTVGRQSHTLKRSRAYPLALEAGKTPECIHKAGGQATLHDWLNMDNPPNAAEIRYLLSQRYRLRIRIWKMWRRLRVLWKDGIPWYFIGAVVLGALSILFATARILGYPK